MKLKEYNPCGDLTGREREICNAALTSYFDLPFVQVMRNVTLAEISNVKDLSNVDKITGWSTYNLNDIERQAGIDFNSTEFEMLTPLQVGLSKYFIHLLYENRYNIFYNRLVNFCNEENISLNDAQERVLDHAAQNYDYFTSFNTLTENFKYALSHEAN